jgi:hypothetical protein
MAWTRRRFAVLACIVGVVTLAIGIGVATGAKLKNGGFESGDFSRWQVENEGEGDWFVYSGTEIPGGGDGPPLPRGGPFFFAPPQGTFGAVTNQPGPGLHILHRTLKLKPDNKHRLKLRIYYVTGSDFHSPPTFEFDEGKDNQQYRIDVLKKRAPIDSLKKKDILVEIFGTEPGDPSSLAPKKLSVNLTKFAGKKVRLRLAEVDNQGNFYAAVDAVKLKSKPKK